MTALSGKGLESLSIAAVLFDVRVDGISNCIQFVGRIEENLICVRDGIFVDAFFLLFLPFVFFRPHRTYRIYRSP